MHTSNKLLLAVLATHLCASAHAEVQQRAHDGFTAVDARNGINVDIRIGDEFLVEVESNENVDHIVTEVRNGTLRISIDRDFFDHGSWTDEYDAFVIMPALAKIEASGGSDVVIVGTVTGDSLDIDASGGADLEVEVAVNRIEISSSGGADVEVSGTANVAIARSSGGSDVDARDLEVKDAELRASGGSDLVMSVTETLDARASGGSDIDYYGDPRVLTRDESGSSDITGH